MMGAAVIKMGAGRRKEEEEEEKEEVERDGHRS
jgi:hypothetical protein